MIRVISTAAAVAVLLLTIFSFKKKDHAANTEGWPRLPKKSYNYVQKYPAHIEEALAAADNMPAANPITNDGVTLGRVLFYDKNLSLNRTVSCASCHRQENSFDDVLPFSNGVLDDVYTLRNSMTLLNLRFYKSGRMFWRENSPTLEHQVLRPITNANEMGLIMDTLQARVTSLPYYPELFRRAFGSPKIDTARIAMALAQFARSLVTVNARYDRVKQGLDSFTAEEARGEQLFTTARNGQSLACASCHTPPMFLSATPAAPFAFPNEKTGIMSEARFKSGSLRNIAVRKSLFHKGSVPDVSAMLHSGVAGSAVPEVPLHSLPEQDIPAMLAFLKTLTDDSITTDPRFADPFE